MKPPRASFPALLTVRGSILAILIAALLFAPATIASAHQKFTSKSGDDWLKSMILGAQDLPGTATTISNEVPLAEIIDGVGPYYENIRRVTLRASYERYLTFFDGTASVRIRLTEFANNTFARGSLPKGWESDVRYRAPKAQTHDIDTGNGGELDVVYSVGRVRVEVGLAYPRASGGVKITLSQRKDKLRDLADMQFSKIPANDDLSHLTSVPLGNLRMLQLVLLIVVLVVLQLIISIATTLGDPATLRSLRRTLIPRQESKRMTACGRIHNVQMKAHKTLKRYRLLSTIRALVIILVITIAYYVAPSPAIMTIVLFSLGGVAALLQLSFSKHDSRASLVGFQTARAKCVAVFGAAFVLVTYASAAFLLQIYVGSFLGIPSQALAESFMRFRSAYIWGALLLLGIIDLPLRLGRRLSISDSKRVLERDQRPEILLLRSFLDEQLKIRVHRSGRQPILERISLRRKENFEQILVWALWHHGPVVTLAQPGTRIAPLGATREYHSNDDYEVAVQKRMATSSMIVFIVGRTQALYKEVQAAGAAGVLGKCLFIVPPVKEREVRARLTVLSSALGINSDALPVQDLRNPAVLVIQFDPSGALVLSTAEARTDVAYDCAVEVAIQDIQLTRGQAHVSPSSGLALRFVDPSSLVTVSPPRRQAAKARHRRYLYAAIGLLPLLNLWLTSTLGRPVNPSMSPPGEIVAEQAAQSLESASTGDSLLFASASARSLVRVAQGVTETVVSLSATPIQIAAEGRRVYVSTANPSGVVALDEVADGYKMVWHRSVATVPTDVYAAGGSVFLALPSEGEVQVFDSFGVNRGVLRDAPEPLDIGGVGNKVLVSSTLNATISIYSVADLHVSATIRLHAVPSTLVVAGNSLFIGSIESESIVEYSTVDYSVVRRIDAPSFGGVMAVSAMRISYGTTPGLRQLVSIDRSTGKRVSTVTLPSAVWDLSYANNELYIAYLGDPIVSSVRIAK